MLAVDPTGAYLVRTPRLPISVNGAGDVTAALFLAHLPSGVQTALAKVASSVYAILRRTSDKRIAGDPTDRSTGRDRPSGLRIRSGQDPLTAPRRSARQVNRRPAMSAAGRLHASPGSGVDTAGGR